MLITDIHDLETRNLVRGLVANKTRENSVKIRTISHALRVCPLRDIPPLTSYLIHNDYYDLYFKSIRPKTIKDLFWRRSQPLSIAKARLVIQTVVLESRKDVLGLVRSVRKIADSLLSSDFAMVIQQLSQLEAAYGKSKFALRVLSYLTNLRNGISTEHADQFPDSQLQAVCDHLFNDDTPVTFTIFFNHLLDAFDREIDPMEFFVENFNLISNLRKSDPAKKIYFILFCSALFPTIDVEIENDSTTADLCFSSLVDMVLYLCAIRGPDYVVSLGEDHADENEVEIVPFFPPEQVLLDISDEKLEQAIQSVELVQRESPDISAYRLSNILFPWKALCKWKTAIDGQILSRCQDVASTIRTGDCSGIYPEPLKLAHLSKPTVDERIRLRKYDNVYAGVFSRTFAALSLIEKGQALTEMRPSDLRLLLNQTASLAQLLTVEELRGLKSFGNSGENLVISFLALVMLQERLGDHDTLFELRSTFEDVVTQQFQGDFTKFLQWLNQRTPALCHRIAQLCDIDFLERLYHLMNTFDDVIEARENICRWMGDTFDDNSYRQLADRLSLDARIRLIRGEIDDSRIYVDQSRFRQHITRYMSPLFRKHQRGYIPSGSARKSGNVAQDRSEKDSAVKANFGGPRYYWLDKACDEAFNTFCTDPIFGINSYLSRRIRHGTLRGFVIAPIRKILDADKYKPLWEDPGVAKDLDRWFAHLSDMIVFLRDEYFHFKTSDKPKGAFDPDPIANEERMRVRREYYKRIDELFATGFAHSDISLTLYDHCWNVIQTDLLRIANDLPKVYRNRLRASLPRPLAPEASLFLLHRKLVADLDQTIERLFSQLSGWFSEPEISSLTVSVRDICDAVVVEMREYYPQFESEVRYLGEVDAKLTGNIYQNIYDILKVLIENVIVHGNPEEPITVESIFVKGDPIDQICIEVVSFLGKDQNKELIHESIKAALAPEAALRAMVREGMSGLGKVLAIVQTAEATPGSLDWNLKDEQVSFVVSLPMVIVTLE